MKPIIAIVGRPNTGKSTLFNRITRTRNALVEDSPGVTRDRIYGDATWDDIEFSLVDTGGFVDGDVDDFAHQIRFQVNQAMQDADVIVVVLDGKEGISPFDRDLIQLLRRETKPVFYAVNKIDGLEKEPNIFDFYDLGIDEFYPISAEHGYGIPDLLDALVQILPSCRAESTDAIRLAIVGRPNVGKSSLVNRLLGQERVLVSDVPGTTRDSIDTVCHIDGRTYHLIDTAGIRRKGRVSQKLEKFSIIKALRSLERCDVAMILLDAAAGITEQDVRIAGYAYERGCGIILLLNKWDLVEKDTRTASKYIEQLRYEAKFLSFAPAMTISALTGLRAQKIFSLVEEVYGQYTMRLGTGQINKIIERAAFRTQPSLYRGRRIKLFYTTQVSEKPPTFVCFANYPQEIHFSYKRYLMNQIRLEAGLDKTPIRLIFRKRKRRAKK